MGVVPLTPGPGDFSQQEAALVATFRHLQGVDTVLDLGCGYGRVAHLLKRALITPKRYLGVDHNAEHLARAQELTLPGAVFVESRVQDFDTPDTFDLVVAVELLMHIQPSEVRGVVTKMLGWSHHYVVTCDWTEPLDMRIYDHNWLHDYRSMFPPDALAIDAGPLQSAFVVLRG